MVSTSEHGRRRPAGGAPGGNKVWSAVAALAALAGGGACSPAETARSGEPEEGVLATALGTGEPQAPCKDGDRTCELQALFERMTVATIGDRPPGGSNGLGVFIAGASNGNYCFGNHDGQPDICPEGFYNYKSSVYLYYRDAKTPQAQYPFTKVNASVFNPFAGWLPVELLAVRSEATELFIDYRLDGQVVTASGEGLPWVKLEVGSPKYPTYTYDIVMAPSTRPLPPGSSPPVSSRPLSDWLRRYEVAYRLRTTGSVGAWKSHCTLGSTVRPVSFAGSTYVDGLLGQFVPHPDFVTMSCETGAIDSCMAWGYRPWEASSTEPTLFAACLPAKRASYFLGPHGGVLNPVSYTLNGTPLAIEDVKDINPDPLERLEAVWGPHGAVCLNRKNLRLDELIHAPAFVVPPDVPECPEGKKWQSLGVLATGRIGEPPP
jgi:ADYC domain